MDRKNSILCCTDQAWKMWILHVSGFIAIPLIIATELFSSSLVARDHALLLLLGITLAIGGFAFPCLSIKCPDCGDRWFWRAVSQKKSGNSVKWFEQSACPVCGKFCRELAKE